MKIAVAMSGGVDSSLAAAILQKEGHDVFGITMRQYNSVEAGYGADGGIEADISDAKKVCEILGIDHFVVDIQTEFRAIIEKNFIDEYSVGRTPNPCVLCNPTIKFGKFLDTALEMGAEKIATGHFIKRLKIDGVQHIYIPVDASKDQTYMIWKLNQDQLSKSLFPISEYTKAEVREFASKLNLPIHSKKDSQEICFIKDHYKDFLEKKMKIIPGDIVLQDGRVIGTHRGLQLYTIGQRKGLNTPWEKPLFVLRLDVKKNRIIVTDNPDDLSLDSFDVSDINWISGKQPKDFSNLKVKIRYNSPATEIDNLEIFDYYTKVKLKKPTRAITPGQSAVFYLENELIGGGIIK